MKRAPIAGLLLTLSIFASAAPPKDKNLTVIDLPRVAPSMAGWKTEGLKDELTGKDYVQHSVKSDNTVNLGFPYQGTQKATLTVRKHPKYGQQITFEIDKGQLICHDSGLSFSRCMVDVRFDNKAPRKVLMGGAADGDPTVLLVVQTSGFLKELSTSKTLIVQPVIYQHGAPAFTFQVAGLPATK